MKYYLVAAVLLVAALAGTAYLLDTGNSRPGVPPASSQQDDAAMKNLRIN